MNPVNPIDYYADYPGYRQQQTPGVTDVTPRYSWRLEDSELYSLIQQKRGEHQLFVESVLKLDERRRRNRDYWRGKHYGDDTNMPGGYQSDYVDPIIYENSEKRFSLASQRMPDISVIAKDDNNKAVETAGVVEKFLNKKVNNKVTQRMMKDGLRSHELNYTAAIKCIWDPNLANGTGDFKFVLVNPNRLILDPTAIIPHDGYTADNMEFVGEILEEPVEVVYSKFPGKAQELRQLLETTALLGGVKAPSKIKYEEWWLRYYKDGKTYEATTWFYQTICLDQVRNPYYDWEGYKVFQPKLDANGNYKQTSTLQDEMRYYNYFEIPRKPYMFFTYQNLGESPYDDTTPLEQAIPSQRLVNRVARQITQISENAVPKKIFGNAITKEDARRVSNDPDESIWLDTADVSNAMTWYAAEPPAPELFQLLQDTRQRLDGIFSTHGPIKGEQGNASESGTAKQITREGDLTDSDDLVDIVVERIVFEMAGWAMQMAKLFYDEPHFLRASGNDGSVLSMQLTRKDFQDGLEVDVKANSVDAITNRTDALNLAGRKAIDPLSMFEDMDKTNAKERVRRLIAFINGPQDGYQTYLKEIDTELEATQNTQPAFTQGGEGTETADNAKDDIQQMVEGQILAPPDKFDQTYVQAILSFVRSGQFGSLPDDIKSNFRDFVKQMSQNFQNFNVNTPGAAFAQGPALPMPPGVQTGAAAPVAPPAPMGVQ